jgi:hypothetical protein
MYDILVGKVKLNRIIGTTLVNVSFDPMPAWQANIKEVLDYFLAVAGLILSTPIALMLMVAIKVNSKGPVIYKQERIGLHGKPFFIYKFRSMYFDAEANGPALSNLNDPRVTPVGRFMRKPDSMRSQTSSMFSRVKCRLLDLAPKGSTTLISWFRLPPITFTCKRSNQESHRGSGKIRLCRKY